MRPDSTQAWHHRRVNTRWVDTHTHLNRFDAAQGGEMLERARAEGVAVIGVSTDVPAAITLVATKGLAGVAIGVHPIHAGVSDPAELADLAKHAKTVVAIGECGFDTAGPAAEIQAAAFEVQTEIARTNGLPLILHIDGANAWKQLLDRQAAIDGLTVVRHYFTGDATEAAWHAERGHYLSFGNPLRRERALREIALTYPAERLLVETDSYPLPERRTEPRDVARIAETLALVRGWTFEEASRRLLENTRRAFPKLRL